MCDDDPYMPQESFRECYFCREKAWLYDDDYMGTVPCEKCVNVEDSRPPIWWGNHELWIEKRSGRWFLIHCHRTICHDDALYRIENPTTDNIRFDDDGNLCGAVPWEGYDGKGGIKSDAVW